MTEKKDVFIVVTNNYNLDCTGPHAWFFQCAEDAQGYLDEIKKSLTGPAMYVHGIIEAELEAG